MTKAFARSQAQKLRRLRDDIDRAIGSLDAGKGREINIDDVIARARAKYRDREHTAGSPAHKSGR